MFKSTILAACLVVGTIASSAIPTVAFADGKMSMDLQPWNGRFILETTHVADEIKGSISPSRLSPFINLKLAGVEKWQGMLSQQISSTEIKDKGNGKYEITISALPGGFYSYTYVTKKNGDIEINGMGPTGNLNSAGLKKQGKNLYYYNINYSHDLTLTKAGRYEGSVVAGGATNTGPAYLTVSGDLDPAVLVHDPVLFTVIYVFPFSR